VFAYVVLRGELPTGAKAEAFTKILRDHVAEQLGAIARPDDIRFANNLPKTRSGKIMRRLLRAIARNEDIAQDQDLSTLENPAIVEQLRGNEAALSAPAGKSVQTPAAKKPAVKKAAVKKAAKKASAAKAAIRRKTAPASKVTPKKKAARTGKVAKVAKKASKAKKPVSKKRAAPRNRPAARRKK